MTLEQTTDGAREDLLADPRGFTARLVAWLPSAEGDALVGTRNHLIDINGFVKRHSKASWLEALRSARLTEWEMAHRWPANPVGPARTDDRPELSAINSSDRALWQNVYAVGRADRDRLLTETEPGKLTQAAVIRWTQPDPEHFDGVRRGDARDMLADVEDNSVDLILTDPPYGDEARDLYSWLGEFAARTLRPGGSLCVLTGQSRLPDDIERLTVEPLRYWWTFALMHHASQRLPGIFVMAGWKPMLWFVHGHRSGREMVGDVLRGNPYDKGEHGWTQGDGVVPVVERLCPEGGLVVDPFAGLGRWGELTTTLGRRWIGADVGGEVVA